MTAHTSGQQHCPGPHDHCVQCWNAGWEARGAEHPAEDGGVAAVSAGERHIVVSYQPGSVNLRVLPPDATMGQADADALSAAAGLLATQRDGLAARIEALAVRLERGQDWHVETLWLARQLRAALAAGQEADG